MEIIGSVLDNLGFDAAVFVSQMVLFYILHLALTPLIYQPLNKVQKERDSLTDEKIRDAQRLIEEIPQWKAQYEQAMSEAHKEAQTITQAAINKAENERLDVLDVARKKSYSIISDTRAAVAKERCDAEQALKAEVPALAKAVACKIAEQCTSGEIRDQFLKRLRSVG